MNIRISSRNIWFLALLFFFSLRISSAQPPISKKEAPSVKSSCSDCLQITEFLVYQQGGQLPINKTAEITRSLRISIAPEDTHFELRFAGEGDAYRIAYSLDGIDKDWHYPADNLIRLYRMPAGSYELRVKHSQPDGQWASQVLTIPMDIKRPFNWTTTVLFSLYGLLFFGTVGFGSWQVRSRHRSRQQVQEQTQTLLRHTEELKELNRSKADMFVDIVHEIRSPLSLVMGLNEAIKLERYGRANENIKGASRIALRNGDQLVKLTDEILELSKLEQVTVPLQEKPVHFHPFLHGLYTMIQPCATLKGVDIELHYALDEDLHLLLDRPKFEKIFNNLLTNAVKFTPEKGRVIVKVEEAASGASLRLTVEDSGPGIPEKDLPHIFERYYQSEYKQLFGGYGTGIGLALAKNYALLHGGDLCVASQPGVGTVFTLTLPKKELLQEKGELASLAYRMGGIADDAANPDHAWQAAAQAAGQRREHRVLIVEDNPDMLQFLHELIAPFYHVSLARNGREALNLLDAESEKIDLIVSDVVMPQVDGFELLQTIREDDRWRALPFLMLTAEVRASHRIDAFTFGVDDYLIKPFSSEELLVRMKSLLRNFRRRSEGVKKQSDSPAHEPAASNEPAAEKMTAAELEWLKKLEETVQQEISNRQFNILELASTMAVSERQLFRQIKRLTGMTPNNYLRTMKLYKAKDLLENYTYGTISEVSYAVGFEDPHYFSKIFSSQFGKKPAAYLARYTTAST